MRLLLVEDDPNLSQSLAAQLEQAGYSVERSTDGREGLYYAREYPVDLAIVDLGLPSMSGVELIKQLRADGKEYPILVLTARDRWQDKVEALKLGADDYVLKPFGVHELLARVEAILQRSRTTVASATGTPSAPVFRFGSATIDRQKFTATVDGRSTTLTARELKLAEVFAGHPGEVLARDALLNSVWGVDYFGTTRTLDQHVAQLRKKIEITPDEPRAIVTVHGVGYRYESSAGL
jgi:DNA-binding response OmpR family regulator